MCRSHRLICDWKVAECTKLRRDCKNNMVGERINSRSKYGRKCSNVLKTPCVLFYKNILQSEKKRKD